MQSPPPADPGDVTVAERARALFWDAAGRLRGAAARDEALAEFRERRSVLFVRREPRLESLGRVWRLGVLLVDAQGTPYATGSTTRAADPGRRGYTSESARARAEIAAVAMRSGFANGDTVNLGWRRLALDDDSLLSSDGPLVVRDGTLAVRWSTARGSSSTIELASYLDDRVRLLVDPPSGA